MVGVITDPMRNDAVKRSVGFELCKRVVQLLPEFIVAYSVCDRIFLVVEGLVKNFKIGVLADKGFGCFHINDNSVNLSLFERLYGVRALVVAFYSCIFDIAGKYISGGSELCSDCLAVEVINAVYCVCGNVVRASRYADYRSGQQCRDYSCFFHNNYRPFLCNKHFIIITQIILNCKRIIIIFMHNFYNDFYVFMIFLPIITVNRYET